MPNTKKKPPIGPRFPCLDRGVGGEGKIRKTRPSAVFVVLGMAKGVEKNPNAFKD